jgi:hypothetical protein
VIEGHQERLESLLELGDVIGAKRELEAMGRLAQEIRQPSLDWLVSVYRALLALLEGRLADAERLISQARSQGERAESWSAGVTYGLQVFLLRREQGRLGEIQDLVRRSAERYATYPIWRCVLARVAAESGHESEARAALEALARDRFASLPFDEEWLVGMGLLAETAAALADPAPAPALYELLLPYRDRVAIS